jgi:membrane-associated phospholipid phosphatase
MLQRTVEKILFRGNSTKLSEYGTYAIGNVILMVLLFYVLLNRVVYNWTGQLYPIGSGFRLDFLFGSLDDAIPFVPEMVIFYVYLFYPMVISTMLYFAFVDYKRGYALGWSLVFINAIALILYIVFPVSVYWWHQDLLIQPMLDNFWASQVYYVWMNDTTFNCFPSLHAAVSVICFYTWYRYSKEASHASKALAIVTLIISAGVILSTLFIKQHYIADEIAGTLVAWCVGRSIFNYLWKSFKSAERADG